MSDRVTWTHHTGLVWKHVLPSQQAGGRTLDQVNELMTGIANKVGLRDGPLYAQIKLSRASKPYVIEATPRLDGCHMWKLIREVYGVDLLTMTLQHLVSGQCDAAQFQRIEAGAALELEFMCQAPGMPANYSSWPEDDTSIERNLYYATGESVRPINGQFEKIGYLIHEMS